jgi:hypothetical protein
MCVYTDMKDKEEKHMNDSYTFINIACVSMFWCDEEK